MIQGWPHSQHPARLFPVPGLTPSSQPDSSQSQVGTVGWQLGDGAAGICLKRHSVLRLCLHVTSVSSPGPYSRRALPSSYPVLTLHKQKGVMLMTLIAGEDACLCYCDISRWSWQMPAAVGSSSWPQGWASESCALGLDQLLAWVKRDSASRCGHGHAQKRTDE